MKTTRSLWHVLSTSAEPITQETFQSVLSRIWGASPAHPGPRDGGTVGLAISGGVDSMALALLCSKLQGVRKTNRRKQVAYSWRGLKFQAFVVDHDVRAGSDIEARAVAAILRERGIPTEVLRIEWPHYRNPKDFSNFETYARRYRFRILGKACRDYKINTLLLAHHEDDQAETILTRLVLGHQSTGLTGIKECSGFPENYGEYGIHESGDFSSNQGPDVTDLTNTRQIRWHMKWYDSSPQHLPIESGGISIYRPLLEYSKARLIATCEEADMKWFEDHTNKDPTLTTRNAIRHMYANHKMPAALTKEALLRMSSNIKEKKALRSEAVDEWLTQCHIPNFQTRTGILDVRFPHAAFLDDVGRGTSEKAEMAAELLRRILMLVTPQEHVALSSLHGAVERLFPEIFAQATDAELMPVEDAFMLASSGFTVADVMFQPSETKEVENKTGFLTSNPIQDPPKPRWRLSRQPYISATGGEIPRITIPPYSPDAAWSPWHLWDGRFWIRVHNRSAWPVTITPFTAPYYSQLKNLLSLTYRKFAISLLKNLAKGNVRWTLPCIVRPLEKSHRGQNEAVRILALPTLGIGAEGIDSEILWEVRYKKIDVRGLNGLEDLVIQPRVLKPEPNSRRKEVDGISPKRVRSEEVQKPSRKEVGDTLLPEEVGPKEMRKPQVIQPDFPPSYRMRIEGSGALYKYDYYLLSVGREKSKVVNLRKAYAARSKDRTRKNLRDR